MTRPRGRKRVAILGSTGSIGTQALDVIAAHPDRFEVVGLAAGRNLALLQEQIARFRPRIATSASDGPDALTRVAVESEPEIVLAATDGAVAFDAVLAAIERGTDIAVANKELIVAAGEIMIAAARASGSMLLPVDSEHSALFQCLVGEDPSSVAALVITASGGPFRTASRAEIENATLEQALAHPTWRMGTKNTIDSATMMNKGLEMIEASRLFGQPGERVLIAVHPQSIAHGFVLFTDGSVKAQVCAPDMRIPIGYALAYPDRLPALRDATLRAAPQGDTSNSRYANRTPADTAPTPTHPAPTHAHPAPTPCHPELTPGHPELTSGHPELSPCHPELVEGGLDVLTVLGGKPGAGELRYEFERPDLDRFPCVRLAYQALARGGTAPAVLSAANEVAVRAFVEGKLRFGAIARAIEQTLEAVPHRDATLETVRLADAQARTAAMQIIEGY